MRGIGAQKVIKVADYTNAFNHITFNTAQQAENANASIKVGFLAVLETQGSYTVGDSKLHARVTHQRTQNSHWLGHDED